MALSIKDAETDRLVRRYARKHATSFTGAIKLAVSNALRQEGEAVDEDEDRQRRRETFYQAVRDAQQAYAALPVIDPRTPDELLYDEDGLPK